MALLFNSLVVILFPVLISGFSYETAQQKCTAVQVNTTTTVNQTVDNSFDDPFVRLMRASSIEEALALNILYKDNHIATAADLNSAYDPSSGKLLVKRPFDIPTPDHCTPRNQSVKVENVTGLSAFSRLYPKCIQVPRCGGCCGTPNVDCVPLFVVKEIYLLVEISISDGSLRVVGTYPVEVERHVSCYCVCGLSDEKCAPHKKFNSAACSCICPPKRVHCYPPKMYDPHTCGCVCDSVQNCCESGGVCGFAFNHDTCECDVDRVRSPSSSSKDSAGSSSITTTTKSTTTTRASAITTTSSTTTTTKSTTTTTPTTTRENPHCPDLICPLWSKQRGCQCTGRRRSRTPNKSG